MNVVEAIQNRRSIRTFQQRSVPKHTLKEIFQIAAWAPTHRLKEPWELKIFQGDGRSLYINALMRSYERLGFFSGGQQKKIEQMKAGMEQHLWSIPHHVLVYLEKDPDQLKMDEDFASVSAFIQNAQLAAWDRGIGVLWTSSPCHYEEGFYQELGLNMEQHKIAGLLQMGYPEKVPEPKRRTGIEEKIVWMEG
ncbi:MAG: nitroreductase [Bacillaceae bacterium]|nr:nitroreductase [Bacillaceae bacterium]